MKASLPQNEPARLEALRRYEILDTLPEQQYDDITHLVAHICRVPMATITLLDSDRQWFKSRVGVAASETSRDLAFCAHTILGRSPLVVNDATTDSRFSDNDLVTGDPGIRFYAGVPLIMEDQFALGTLCAIDKAPRQLEPDQLEALEALARQVIALLELRRTNILMRQSTAIIQNLNDELQTRNRELELTNEELEAFNRTVAHDLRNPLNGVHGYAALLEATYADGLDDTGREFITRIIASSNRMAGIITDLLELAQAGHGELRLEPTDLSAMAASVAESLRGTWGDREPTVTIQPALTADCDAGLIRIVLENLIGNALKYSSKAEAPVVEFGSTAADGEQVFYVRDNGAGFDMADAGRLFSTFQRLHSRDDFPGTGIGLATVRRIIERHGGRIWAEAEFGKGATFHFTLAPKPNPTA